MADLSPAVLTIVGTTVGGIIAATAGLLQARSQASTQERILDKRLDHETKIAEDARRAAQEAREADARAARQAEERNTLLKLGDAINATYVGGGDSNWMYTRGLAYQINDPVLWKLVAPHNDDPRRMDHLVARAAYLLRVPDPERRTDDGHVS